MSLIVRKMTVEDVPAAHEIDVLSFTLPWPARSLRFEVSDNPAARCWAAEMDGRLVGMLVLWMILDEAHIATVATHPDHRRKGIAKQLLVEALNIGVYRRCTQRPPGSSCWEPGRAGDVP